MNNELKEVFAKNLNYLLAKHGKTQIEVAEALGIKQTTFSSWCTANKMPRMDKVQLLANYFDVKKSHLIEERPIGMSNGPEQELDNLIKLYRAASPEMQAAALGMLEAAEKARVSMDSPVIDK